MYSYIIAIILALATAVYFFAEAIKANTSKERLLEKYNVATHENFSLSLDNYALRHAYVENLKELKQTKNLLNQHRQSSIKAGIILQSCGSVDCDGKPGNCGKCTGKSDNLFGKRNVCK